MNDPQGDALLQLSASNSGELDVYRQRHSRGEPAPYITGFLVFRGRRFNVDSRAYVTDPELSSLIDVVLVEGDRLESMLGRPPFLVDFGTGAGTLAISIAIERPHWRVKGLDIDAKAIELAKLNAQKYRVDIDFIVSDFLGSWAPKEAIPDLIFGDPPWGTKFDLYDSERDEKYYKSMPEHSVFPVGSSRTGVHDELISQVVARSWSTTLILNCGVLPPGEINQMAAPLRSFKIIEPEPGIRILRGLPQ